MSEKQEITAPDLTVSIPQKWEDQGYIAWSKPVTNGEKFAPNIVISRSFLEKDQILDTYATAQMENFLREGKDFILHDKTSSAWKGFPSIVLTFDWTLHELEVSQRQVYIQRKDRSVVNVTFSTAGGDFEMNEELFNEILDSLELLEKE